MFDLVSFDFDHAIEYFNTDMTPFDDYSLNNLVYVIEKDTNKSVPIVTVTAGQAPDNFDISSVDWETMSNYTYDSGAGPTTTMVQSRMVYIQTKRSLFARALIMCLLLVNWALTTGSIYIVLVVVCKTGKINEAVLLLPVTIVLTVPTLRGLYAGSPPFGIFIGKSRALRS